MTPFIESPRFPDEISYGSSGGPTFFNNKVVAPNGQRKVNIRRAQPLGAYNVAMGVKTQAQLNELHAFFMSCYGGAIAFRYKDWADFRVAPGQGLLKPLAGGGSQMYKRYSISESMYFDRKIQKPVQGTVSLTGGAGTVDYATGIVTGNATGWHGEFDTPCAFTGDSFSADISNFETYNASLPLEIVQL